MNTKELIEKSKEAIKRSEESIKHSEESIKETEEILKESKESMRRSDEAIKRAKEAIEMLKAANESIQKTKILMALERILTDQHIDDEFDIGFYLRYRDSENYTYLHDLYFGYKRAFLLTFYNNDYEYINEPEVLREKTLDDLQNNNFAYLDNLFEEITLFRNSEEILTDKYEILKNYINDFLSKLHEIMNN